MAFPEISHEPFHTEELADTHDLVELYDLGNSTKIQVTTSPGKKTVAIVDVTGPANGTYTTSLVYGTEVREFFDIEAYIDELAGVVPEGSYEA